MDVQLESPVKSCVTLTLFSATMSFGNRSTDAVRILNSPWARLERR